ncbi:type IV pilus assembly protein PilM [Candidatus Falkowbacteria bacterium]|nr:type IV pilus assembly protein PilM [Candidatus Falkowbacteria bacterium]
MLLTSASEKPVGIDISELSLKLIQLNKSGDSIKIQAISQTEIAPGVIDDGEIKQRGELIKAFKKLLNSPQYGQITSTDVTACLPENKTFVKLIEIDSGPNNPADVIRIEMEKHIPLPIDEIYFDWQVISQGQGKTLILLGAAPKTIVDSYTTLFDEIGMTAFALEIESSAICRALLTEERPKQAMTQPYTYAILDIGANRTSMIVYSNQSILFTVSLPISGESVTQNIADNLKIDRDQAEKAKIVCGLDENKAQGVIKEILSSLIDELVKKITEVTNYHQLHFTDYPKIQKIYLCGGGSNIDNIDKLLTEALQVEVVLGDPMINLKENNEKINLIFSKKPQSETSKKINPDDYCLIKNPSLSFTTAIGLSLRGVFVNDI